MTNANTAAPAPAVETQQASAATPTTPATSAPLDLSEFGGKVVQASAAPINYEKLAREAGAIMPDTDSASAKPLDLSEFGGKVVQTGAVDYAKIARDSGAIMPDQHPVYLDDQGNPVSGHPAYHPHAAPVGQLPEAQTRIVPPDETVTTHLGTTPGSGSIEGISAAPKDDSIGGKLSQWAQNVKSDIENGTDVTGVGTILKKLGAHGLYNGNSHAVGNLMGSLPVGLLTAAKGAGEVLPRSAQEFIVPTGRQLEGAKDVATGVAKAGEIPAMMDFGPGVDAAAEGAVNLAKAGGQAVKGLQPGVRLAKTGESFENLSQAIGEHPVTIHDALSDATMRINELANRGSTMPKVARDFIKRTTDPAKGPLTYDEARDFAVKAGSLSADEAQKMSGPMRAALTDFSKQLNSAVADTTERAGKLQQYQKAMQDYHAGKQLQSVLDWAKDFSVKGIAQKAGAAGALAELKKLIG